MEVDLNEFSRVSAPRFFDFTIAAQQSQGLQEQCSYTLFQGYRGRLKTVLHFPRSVSLQELAGKHFCHSLNSMPSPPQETRAQITTKLIDSYPVGTTYRWRKVNNLIGIVKTGRSRYGSTARVGD